ncbi:hypothetical protein CPC08DRAFT_368124 [Agrocybe pediades]|nr:hypothetical protein CPC08DRAFT_368124 [Agrocybe pediades]
MFLVRRLSNVYLFLSQALRFSVLPLLSHAIIVNKMFLSLTVWLTSWRGLSGMDEEGGEVQVQRKFLID